MKVFIKYTMIALAVLISMTLVSCQKTVSVSGSNDYYAGRNQGVKAAEMAVGAATCPSRIDVRPFIDRSTQDQVNNLTAEGRSEGYIKGFYWGYRDTLGERIAANCSYYLN